MSTWHLAHPCPCDLESLRSLRCLENKDGSSQRYQADSTWWTGDAGKRQVHHCAARNAHNANMYSYLLLWDQTSTWQEQDLPQRQRGWILDLTLQIFWSFRMLALCFKCPSETVFVCFLWTKNAKSLVQSIELIESYDALALGLASWRGTFQPWAGNCDGRLFHWRRGFWAHLPSTQRFWRQKVKEEKRGNIGIGLAWLSGLAIRTNESSRDFQGMTMNNCIEQTSHPHWSGGFHKNPRWSIWIQLAPQMQLLWWILVSPFVSYSMSCGSHVWPCQGRKWRSHHVQFSRRR